ncbi:Replication factor C, subunit RFC2 [Pseudoloma neurophilia]|uniref:Replication factor C, subunit RFC2 n=1 Tax=Pseudoloma neurophilia TaxID=146866 RepID=A0A0R0LU16_9MICR|nr:Replication factor C, subunit RFC2 [Pseudoloma neurophilia]
MDVLLTEKYRPKKIDDVIGNKSVIAALKSLLQQETLPHLLFTGPPGTGKTTVAKIIAKRLIEDQKNVLELNASDERGIDTVRTTIKNFSMRKVKGFKLIILDECDSMTSAAQQAMRRTMELCAIDCRFILICNDIRKITEAIQSRCAIYLFDKISEENMKNKLIEICKKENIIIPEDALNIIIYLSENDMRQAINILQSTLYLDEINESNILKVTGQPSPKLIEEIVINAFKQDYSNAHRIFDTLWDEGYDSKDLASSFFKVAKKMENYSLISLISEFQHRFSKVTASKLQFYSLIYNISTLDK